jgi:uncharacterized membrane protein YdjX (TVP38/TMEM64 family)
MPTEPRTGGGEPAHEDRPPLTGVAIALAGIAVLAIVVLAIEPLRTGFSNAVQGDTGSLRAEIRDLGATGALIVLALALAHAVVWYPTEILDTATGYVYGFWGALPLIMAGWVASGIIGHWIGSHAARPLLHRLAGAERFERLESVAERGGATLLLAMRLIPVVPFGLFSLAGGAARVPLGRFVWTTAVGYLPITAVFVYLGSRLEELSPTDPVLWIGAGILIALLFLSRRIRQLTRETPQEESGR